MKLTDRSKYCFYVFLLFGLTACSGENLEITANEVDADTEILPVAETEVEQATVVVCAEEGAADETISVLLVGNSLMDGVKSNLKTLLRCGGYTPDIDASNPGGYYLYQHDDLAETTELIAKGYDLVLLQEQSSSIEIHVSPYTTLDSLNSKIEAAGGQLAFYQTWAFQARDVERTNRILERYESLGAEFNAPVIHIGRAWDYFYTSNNENPPFALFADYAHSTSYGKALITYVLYSYLTDSSAEYLSRLSLNEEDSYLLQKLAWDIYNIYKP